MPIAESSCRKLIEAFQLAEADDDVHLIIVTGAGRAFSAGYAISGGRDEQETITLQLAIASARRIWRSACSPGKPVNR